MNSEPRSRRIPLVAILTGVLFALLALVVIVFIASATVTGSATLPNGSDVGITTKGLGFGVASNQNETRIEAGGYVVEVDEKLTVRVNGSEVGMLDEEPKHYDLVIDSEGLQMRSAERTVARIK